MKQAIVWVLLLALGLRVSAALAVQSDVEQRNRSFLIEGDANGYWELGRRLANGEAYEIYTPPRRAMRMPGFPSLLALSIKLAGENLTKTAKRLMFLRVGLEDQQDLLF